MTQEASQIRLHMGCGESLRSQMLLTEPRRWQARTDERRAQEIRLPTRASANPSAAKPTTRRGRPR